MACRSLLSLCLTTADGAQVVCFTQVLLRQEMPQCIKLAMACATFVCWLLSLVSAQCYMVNSSNLVLMKVQ